MLKDARYTEVSNRNGTDRCVLEKDKCNSQIHFFPTQTIMWYANYQLFAIIHRPLPQLPPSFIHNLHEQMKAQHLKWSIFPNNKILMEATRISSVGVKALATV